ncbi:MAG: gluconeogenesis factor YvcK family protein [Pyrinomonadaceae bacterium]
MEIQRTENSGLNCVAIGGGNGLSTLLSGVKQYVGTADDAERRVRRLSAIVAVSDDGGSSGRLRDELQMPPPGDIRSCMVALSEDSHLLSRLFRHRFSGSGGLGGHSFGNLFLAALCEITGDFAEAVKLSSEILASKGHIYPATISDVRIAAELKDGTIVRGETRISKVGPQIARIYLEPDECQPLPEALTAIAEADVITIGPGSLYTSLLPPLLVKGVAEAIVSSSAVKIMVCNLMTQPGETDGMTTRRHVEIISEYAPDLKFNHIVVNTQPVNEIQAEEYLKEGSEQIGADASSNEGFDSASIVCGDLLDVGPKVRHDPAKLASIVLGCARRSSRVQSLDAV